MPNAKHDTAALLAALKASSLKCAASDAKLRT